MLGDIHSSINSRTQNQAGIDLRGDIGRLELVSPIDDATVFSNRNTAGESNVISFEVKGNGDVTSTGTVEAAYFKGDGSQLSGVGGASVKISATKPDGTSSPGDLWWDSTNGILYIYYTDEGIEGDDAMEASSQWVDARPGAGDIGDITTALSTLKQQAAAATNLNEIKAAFAAALANF